MGLVPINKYSVVYLAFPVNTKMSVAMQEYREKFGIEAVKAIVPVRDDKNSAFNYDIDVLAKGAPIEIEPSRSVSCLYLTDHEIVWANSPSLIQGEDSEE